MSNIVIIMTIVIMSHACASAHEKRGPALLLLLYFEMNVIHHFIGVIALGALSYGSFHFIYHFVSAHFFRRLGSPLRHTLDV